jgi:ribonuclease BN (tRNA processing enzyme)
VTNLSVRFGARGRRCAFSGDGGITEDTAALYAGVDTLFHELFAARRDVPGHTNLVQLRGLVDAIRPARVVVSHHGRRYKAGVRRAVAKLGPAPTEWVSAEPGDVFEI